jgi:hypothetical protein
MKEAERRASARLISVIHVFRLFNEFGLYFKHLAPVEVECATVQSGGGWRNGAHQNPVTRVCSGKITARGTNTNI